MFFKRTKTYTDQHKKSITSLTNFFNIFLIKWRYDEGYNGLFNVELFIKNTFAYFFPSRDFRMKDLDPLSINIMYDTQST